AQVIKVMTANAQAAKTMIAGLPALPIAKARALCPCGCDRALDNALITAETARDPDLLAKLDAVAGRVL
ncbi:MAG: 5'-methylthioadenosine phosphorylase, partial [Paracoccaceae bacterium]